MHLYEDLVSIGRSSKLANAIIKRKDRVLNVQNRLHGIAARRGDGTFGELIPGERPIIDPGYRVARGPVATIEIGIEMKILLKAMIKQIDRVINDLRNQVLQFRRAGGNPICVAIIGINEAESVVGYEGERSFPTAGRGGYLHPSQEALEAQRRLRAQIASDYDEFLVLRFKATNAQPYPFEWANQDEARLDYAAALTRISARYQQRF